MAARICVIEKSLSKTQGLNNPIQNDDQEREICQNEKALSKNNVLWRWRALNGQWYEGAIIPGRFDIPRGKNPPEKASKSPEKRPSRIPPVRENPKDPEKTPIDVLEKFEILEKTHFFPRPIRSEGKVRWLKRSADPPYPQTRVFVPPLVGVIITNDKKNKNWAGNKRTRAVGAPPSYSTARHRDSFSSLKTRFSCHPNPLPAKRLARLSAGTSRFSLKPVMYLCIYSRNGEKSSRHRLGLQFATGPFAQQGKTVRTDGDRGDCLHRCRWHSERLTNLSSG